MRSLRRIARRGREHLVDLAQSAEIYLVIRDERGKENTPKRVFSFDLVSDLRQIRAVFRDGIISHGAKRVR